MGTTKSNIFITYKEKHQKIDTTLSQQIINRKTVTITDNNRWETNQISKAFSQIKMWKVQDLQLTCNKHKQVLITISHIAFPSLKKLSIADNDIESIEVLSRVDLPVLQEFHFGCNQVNSLRLFGKVILKQLKLMGISYNRFYEGGSSLNRMGCFRMQILTIDFWENREETIHDLSWVCKQQSSSLKSLNIKNERRIKQKKLLQTISHKFRHIEIEL